MYQGAAGLAQPPRWAGGPGARAPLAPSSRALSSALNISACPADSALVITRRRRVGLQIALGALSHIVSLISCKTPLEVL